MTDAQKIAERLAEVSYQGVVSCGVKEALSGCVPSEKTCKRASAHAILDAGLREAVEIMEDLRDDPPLSAADTPDWPRRALAALKGEKGA